MSTHAGRSRTLLLSLSLLIAGAPVHGQAMSGAVIDAQTKQAVSGASVEQLSGDGAALRQAVTGNDGSFSLPATPGARYRLRITAAGYDTLATPAFSWSASAPPFRLEIRRVEGGEVAQLDTLAVAGERAPTAAVRTEHLLAGERLALLDRAGVSAQGLFRELGGSLRVRRHGRSSSWMCVETTRRVASLLPLGPNGPVCEWVSVYVDGVSIGTTEECIAEELRTRGVQMTCGIGLLLNRLRVSDYESIEFIPPLHAATEYGLNAGATGALVLWTRGRGPHRSSERAPR